MRQVHARALLVLVTGGLLALPAGAGAAELWADPDRTDGGHDCSASDACRLRDAIQGAGDGDRVILRSGEYDVNQALDVPAAITLEGEPGRPRPRLVATGAPAGALLSFREGGVVRRLALDASANGDDALALEGAVGEDLELVAGTGDGAKLHGSPATTLLRDSVVRTGDGDGLKLRDGSGGGDVALRNVTVVADGGTAIRCETTAGLSTLVNVLARGDDDVDGDGNAVRCEVTFSNLRPGHSPGIGSVATNQEANPLFVDRPGGDLRLQPGSRAVDAGTTGPLLGPRDPDGAPRLLGSAPDIGAFEQSGLPSTGPVPVVPAADPPAPGPEPDPPGPPASDPPPPPAPPAPVPGKTVVAGPDRGTVLVKAPGGGGWVRLIEGASIPLGAVIDARHGRIRLTSATDDRGHVQTGLFDGGRFRVAQTGGPRPMTELALTGGDFSACRPARATTATAAARRRSKVVRRLWGRDGGGRFRTRGRTSSATVRGTVWLTEDRCDGTRVVVREGAVDVRPNRGGRTRRVRAGRSLLVRR